MPHDDKHISTCTCSCLKPFRRKLWAAVIVLIIIVLLAACGGTATTRGELGDNQSLLSTCEPNRPPASFVAIDGSGSSASDAITAERMTAIESIARRTAVCSGVMRVIVFSASSAATTVLFDRSLKMDGATDNARLRHVPAAVSDTMHEIRQAYDAAVKALPQSGSDIVAQLRLASEWSQQLGREYRLRLHVFSDGFQNIGVDLAARPLGQQEAEALASQVAVPKLQGASITVAGLGRVASTPPPSSVVEGLIHYYNALCRRTEATFCLSVSDFATEGR